MTGPTVAPGDELPRPAAHIDDVVVDESTLEIAVLDEERHAVHVLNTSAAAVWLLCDGETTPAGMATELAEIFGVESDAAANAVDDALEQFARYGFLAGHAADETRPPIPSARVLAREPDP